MMHSTKPSNDTLQKLITKNPAGFKAGIFKGKKDKMASKFKKKVTFVGEKKLKPNS